MACLVWALVAVTCKCLVVIHFVICSSLTNYYVNKGTSDSFKNWAWRLCMCCFQRKSYLCCLQKMSLFLRGNVLISVNACAYFNWMHSPRTKIVSGQWAILVLNGRTNMPFYLQKSQKPMVLRNFVSSLEIAFSETSLAHYHCWWWMLQYLNAQNYDK